MKPYQRILFLTDGLTDDRSGLAQALELANQYQARLRVLIHYPNLPSSFDQYRQAFEAHLLQRENDRLAEAAQRLNLSDPPQADIQIESGHAPHIRAIQTVLKEGHDLLIKQVSSEHEGKGFDALDMGLLRKCPVPVWLHRPTTQTNKEVAVAIDPGEKGSSDSKLAVQLLQASSQLAQWLGLQLKVISCWDYPLETYLRNRAFIHVQEQELEALIAEADQDHERELNRVIESAQLAERPKVYRPRGAPDVMIPDYTAEHPVALLVMGTVARTGIPGLLIGNTAENILQKIDCSLLAMKPEGFETPVK